MFWFIFGIYTIESAAKPKSLFLYSKSIVIQFWRWEMSLKLRGMWIANPNKGEAKSTVVLLKPRQSKEGELSLY